VGIEWADDAAVVRLPNDSDHALVLTTDTIAPLVDDPFCFGQIAAANALSDVYAMGGTPLYALNLVFFPDDKLPLTVLVEIMNGAAATCREAGVPIVGGHTVRNGDVKFGLAVTGQIATNGNGESVLANTKATEGQVLVISKALGTGVLGTGIKSGEATTQQQAAAIASMCKLNRDALQIGRQFGVSACTDVTGFGLLGHLRNIVRGSGLCAHLDMRALPLLPGALELARAGRIPGGSKANLDFVDNMLIGRQLDNEEAELLTILAADAQTSGGLLMSFDPPQAKKACAALCESGHAAACIGELRTLKSGTSKATITLSFD